MSPLSTVIAFTFTFLVAPSALQTASLETIPLADAMKAFNETAAKDPIGKDQSPLTEEEVIGAVRHLDRTKDMPVTEEMFEAFKQIAETRELPPNAEFESLTGYDPGGDFVFDVWSVRIRMYRPDRSSYAFIIRERMIRSRTIEEELVLAEKRLEDFPPVPGKWRVEKRVEDLKARIAKKKAK
jgi:hypothetical protein